MSFIVAFPALGDGNHAVPLPVIVTGTAEVFNTGRTPAGASFMPGIMVQTSIVDKATKGVTWYLHGRTCV